MWDTVMSLVALVGSLMLLVGAIWMIVVAFQTSILWGLGCLFIGPLWIVFTILNWQVAKRPFFLQLKGVAVILLAVVLSGGHLPLFGG